MTGRTWARFGLVWRSACDATRAVWHDRAAVRRHVGGL